MNINTVLIMLAVVVLPVILAWFFISRLNSKLLRDASHHMENFELGLRKTMNGSARVINKTEEINPQAKGIAKVDLQLEVQIPDKAPYQMATVWLVEVASLESAAPGKSIPVKVDAKDPARVYPNVPWARPWLFGK
jgi:hypothetical protein